MLVFRNRMLGGAALRALMPLSIVGDGTVAAGAEGAGSADGAGGGGDAAAVAAAAAAAAAAAGTGDGKPAAGADGKPAAGADGKPAVGADGKPAVGADGKPIAAGDGDGKQISTPADFPADWREKMAGTDTALLAQLKRYGSPADVAAWVRDTSLKIVKGELKSVAALPKDATPEQTAAWRKDQGLPEKAETYVEKLALPDGMVMGEKDKPNLQAFAGIAHAANLTQEQFTATVKWWNESQDQAVAAQKIADGELQSSTAQQLMQELGGDYKGTMNGLKSFWSQQPAGIDNLILTARTPDGRVLGDIAEAVKWISGVARTIDPAGSLLPAGAQSGQAGISERKSQIEGMMYLNGKQNPAYFGNEKLRGEYRDLIEAEQALASRQRVA